MAGAVAILAATSLVACLGPARRAVQVSPLVALSRQWPAGRRSAVGGSAVGRPEQPLIGTYRPRRSKSPPHPRGQDAHRSSCRGSNSGRTLRHPIAAAGASLHGNGSGHARAEHRFDDRGVHTGRRPAVAAAAGERSGRTLQHRRAREKRRPQSLGTTHMGSTSTCGPRTLSSATCWPRLPPFHPVSTFPTVRSRIACDASSYPVTTSTCSALERRRDGP